MKLITALILLCATTAAMANPFPGGDAKTGKTLFDKYKCNSCHSAMIGGDGSGIFTRPEHKVRSPSDMFAQFKMCSANIGITLTAQEEQHLGAYLNKYYNFK